jgi:cyclopropane fatty-acyl-phospholipid synthase-like methyltransferase
MRPTYDPSIFDAPDAETARRIILTPERDADTDTRWERETPYIADLAVKLLEPTGDAIILDYGCGIGRISKALIERLGCRVVGVDISPNMRRLATDYVGDGRFEIWSPQEFRERVSHGFRVDAAVAIWVLQHCEHPQDDIEMIAHALKPQGRLGVVNSIARWVPTREMPWADDRVSIGRLLDSTLTKLAAGRLDPEHVGLDTARASFWALHRRGT